MSELTKIDEILDFAIKNEQDAVELYTNLAATTKRPEAKAVFEEYADEERAHKVKLEQVKTGRQLLGATESVQDLNISDYTVDEELSESPDHQAVLLFAMKLEKAAFRLYTELAGRIDNAKIKELLLGLAQEEAKHKLRFELEYDREILTHN